jgi:hypothetical protein
LNCGKSFAVSLLVVHGKGDQSAIDKIDDAGFARAGSAVARNDARSDGCDFFGFLGREVFEFLCFGRCRGAVSMVRGGKNCRPVSGGPGCAESSKATGQKLSAVEFSEQWSAFYSFFATVSSGCVNVNAKEPME